MNTKSTYLFLFILLASLLTACGAPAPTAIPIAIPIAIPTAVPTAVPTFTPVPTLNSTAVDPTAIAQGFWDAVNAKNIEAAMAFVAYDVVIHGGPTKLSSKAELSAFMSSESEKGNTFEITDLKLYSEDTVTYTMKFYTPKGTLMVGSPYLRIQVKDDKIVLIEFP